MAEVYTCICGGQRWTILGTEIECDKCGKEYRFRIIPALPHGTHVIENPKAFNKRIKKEG